MFKCYSEEYGPLMALAELLAQYLPKSRDRADAAMCMPFWVYGQFSVRFLEKIPGPDLRSKRLVYETKDCSGDYSAFLVYFRQQ